MKKLVLFLSMGLLTITLISCSGGSVVSSAATSVDTPQVISVVTAQ